MDEATIQRLLDDVRAGEVHPDDALAALRRLPYRDLGFARVDHHRALRQGMPEAVYGPGKSPEHAAAIVRELLDAGASPVLLTRATDAQAAEALAVNPQGVVRGSTIVWRPAAPRPERVVVCTAGTADLPVAEECVAVLEAHGVEPIRITDAGVAGIHRLLADADVVADADAVVVVAGMEGALASVVGGLTSGDRRAHERRLRRRARGRHRAPRDAVVVCGRADRRRHRQRVRGGHRGAAGAQVTRLAWFHCFSGIAGDMALGSLVDAGADLDEVRALLDRLPLGGWAVEAEAVLRCGIAATKVHVHAEEGTVVRTAAHIAALVEEARLPQRVSARSLAVFAALAEAEGKLHRRPAAQVHFHEVGGLDAIVDVVGTCAALEVLDIDEVQASTVVTGTGMIRSAHGMLPNPAPAVVALLASVGAPTTGLDVGVELTTPTGAALLAALADGFGPLPSMSIDATGFGAGTREIDGRPNATQVVIGMSADALGAGQPVVLLEANVDDATGEMLSHAVTALLDVGAHDAWVTPIVMKKGRPAYTVSALADTALAAQVASTLTAETGSLGVRGTSLERWPSARSADVVEVEGYPIRVKVSPGRVKVEHDDAARVARRSKLPLREVLSRAEAAGRTGLHVVPDVPDDDPDGGPPHGHAHSHDHHPSAHDHDGPETA